MYIKASGTALRDMRVREGWRRLRLDSVLSIVKDKSISQLETQAREMEVVKRLFVACDDEVAGESRPSVEAHLHAFLDKCVIHLHPVAVLAYCCAKNGRVELEKLFKGEKFPPVWVPYTDPGFMLAKKITNVVGSYQRQFGTKPAILFLQKHGLLVSANRTDAALGLLRKVINRCMSKLRQPKGRKVKPVSQQVVADVKQSIRKAFFEATGQRPAIDYFCDGAIAGFWSQRDARAPRCGWRIVIRSKLRAG
jgi:rhamnose utilization protein RhaD (predicted bifunctional aldolase and dehydrogenase)